MLCEKQWRSLFERMVRSLRLLFWSIVLLWAFSEILGATRNMDRGKTQDRGSWLLLAVALIFGSILGFVSPTLLPYLNITPPAFLPLLPFGAALALIGIVCRWYAIAILGRYFTIVVRTQHEHTVVRHGPYRLVRHPSYTGLLLTVLGIAMMMMNWASLLLMTLSTFLALLYRVTIEEQVLQNKLGEAYQDYMRHTRKRFIPFIF